MDKLPVKLVPRAPQTMGLRDPEKVKRRKMAFDLWSEDPRRSFTRVSEEMDIGLATVYRWAREDGWRESFKQRDNFLPKDYVRVRGEEMMDDAMERLHSVIVGGQDRDAINAVKIFAGLMGIDQSGPQVTLNDNRSINQINGMEIRNAGDMRKALALVSEGNIIDVESKRRNRD